MLLPYLVGKQRKGLTASNDLGGQNEYAYCTITTILWGVFEINFFDKCRGFSVKSEQTDRQTLFRFIYIDVEAKTTLNF